MIRLLLGSGLAIASALLLLSADRGGIEGSDVQLRAMADELARSRGLQLGNLDRPYFIQYSTSDSEQFIATASLGGMLNASRVHIRMPGLQVRVGGTFDNTNSVYSRRPRFGLFPLDEDYQAMRSSLWLATDTLYKSAIDQITRKRSALNEIAEPDKTPDFAPARPVRVIEPVTSLKLQEDLWRDCVRELSNEFASYQSIATSQVRFRSIASTYRLVNSEGTTIRVPQNLTDISISAAALAPDGSRVWNHEFVTVLTPSQLPSQKTLLAITRKAAAETDALAHASAGEDYAGPVLFEGEAAAEMMAQVFTDAARLARKPLAPPGSNAPGSQIIESVWASRVGSKVMPEWITVVDDPGREKSGDSILAGAFRVDDEGVPAERVVIVENGVLKNFLLSRLPVRKFNASNGHGRLTGNFGSQQAAIGNLLVQASSEVSEEQLKAKLIEKVKASGLQYGLIIRRLDFPSTSNLEEVQSLARQMQKNGYTRTLNAPILAYKVYPDGHEELVRGLRFGEFSAKDLRDIAAASDRSYVLNYVNNGSSLNMADSGSDATTSSVVCPSLLLESLELVRGENDAGRPPIVPAPPLVTP